MKFSGNLQIRLTGNLVKFGSDRTNNFFGISVKIISATCEAGRSLEDRYIYEHINS